ncbi:hypothetical protein B0H14DRAFT_3575619 [Mycena olivaceomarginata]|nr:hypothetical protein B0H14DRAFT_3575619 [Mycena olivaceomarginata]
MRERAGLVNFDILCRSVVRGAEFQKEQDGRFTRMLFNQTEMETCILGAWDLGACSSLFLEGVLCAQFAHYLSLNKRDSICMKLFVAGLVLLTTLKSLQSLAMMWIQSITLFGDREAASNIWLKHWVWNTSLTLEAITAFYVQISFVATGDISEWVSCHHLHHFVSVRACFRRRCDLLPIHKYLGVDGPLDWNTSWSRAVWRLAFDRKYNMSAAPAALCASINFAGSMRVNATTWMPGLVMINFIPNMVLPQLYAWSAMWTLDSREEICVAAEDTPEPLVKAQKVQLDSRTQSMA